VIDDIANRPYFLLKTDRIYRSIMNEESLLKYRVYLIVLILKEYYFIYKRYISKILFYAEQFALRSALTLAWNMLVLEYDL
jgi:hypothetical protein